MLIARWQIDARFGHKQTVIDLLQRWLREVGAKAGTDKMDVRCSQARSALAKPPSRQITRSRALPRLNASSSSIGKIDAHKQWGKDLEPFVVSGSSRWDIYRVI